jgi:hypothetical protein
MPACTAWRTFSRSSPCAPDIRCTDSPRGLNFWIPVGLVFAPRVIWFIWFASARLVPLCTSTMGGPPIDSGPPIDNLLVHDQFFVKSLLFFFLAFFF